MHRKERHSHLAKIGEENIQFIGFVVGTEQDSFCKLTAHMSQVDKHFINIKLLFIIVLY